jgi:hypothetical protein
MGLRGSYDRIGDIRRNPSRLIRPEVEGTGARHSGETVMDVRFGSKADIELAPVDVRFTPESGHQLSALGCPLSARSRLASESPGLP